MVEVLIGIALAALLLAAVGAAMISTAQSVSATETQHRSQRAAMSAMNYLIARIRPSTRLDFSDPLEEENTFRTMTCMTSGPTSPVQQTFSWDSSKRVLSVKEGSSEAVDALHGVTRLAFRSLPDLTNPLSPQHRYVTIDLELEVTDPTRSTPTTIQITQTVAPPAMAP